MMSRSDLSPDEQETIQKLKDPLVIKTANGTSGHSSDWHPGSVIISTRMGEHRVQNRQPHSVGGPRRASNRAPDQSSARTEANTSCVEDHEGSVETKLPESL